MFSRHYLECYLLSEGVPNKIYLRRHQPCDGDPTSQRCQHLQCKGSDRHVKEYLRRMRMSDQPVQLYLRQGRGVPLPDGGDRQEVAAMALKDKEAFYSRLGRRMEKQYLADTDSLKKEYENLAQRNQEIDDTFISSYADKAKRILTEKRFLKLTDTMEKEQDSNQNRMQEISAVI